MSWGEVELEPEVRDWYLGLDPESQARVQFNVDRLADAGPLLDEPFTKQLDGKLRELRFYLTGQADAYHLLDCVGTKDHLAHGVREIPASRAA